MNNVELCRLELQSSVGTVSLPSLLATLQQMGALGECFEQVKPCSCLPFTLLGAHQPCGCDQPLCTESSTLWS